MLQDTNETYDPVFVNMNFVPIVPIKEHEWDLQG